MAKKILEGISKIRPKIKVNESVQMPIEYDLSKIKDIPGTTIEAYAPLEVGCIGDLAEKESASRKVDKIEIHF